MSYTKDLTKTQMNKYNIADQQTFPDSESSQELCDQAKARLYSFHCYNSLKINFWSLSGELLDRWQLRFHLAQFGTIAKLFLQPDRMRGSVEYREGTDLRAAAGKVFAVTGSSRVAFVRASLPRIFLGGLNPRATEAEVRRAVAPFGKVARFSRHKKNGRAAGFCLLTFFTEEAVLRILQQRKVEVMGRHVTVRMEGEKNEPDRIYDHYGPEWHEGHTLLLYGFGDPDAIKHHDVAWELEKYGKVMAVQFVFQDGRRQPRCFVDFEDASCTKIAMTAGSCCVQGQVLGLMEVKRNYLDCIMGRPKVRVTEDPLDDDLEVPPIKEFDITKIEKEQALSRALSLMDAVCTALLPEENAPFVQEIKFLASACPELINKQEEEEATSKRKREDSPYLSYSKCLRMEDYGDSEEDEEDKKEQEDEDTPEAREDKEEELNDEEMESEDKEIVCEDKQRVSTKHKRKTSPSEGQRKRQCIEKHREEKKSEDEEKINIRRQRDACPSEEIQGNSLSIENYEAMREKILQMIRSCMHFRKLQCSKLRTMLKEHRQPVLQPCPAQDTLVSSTTTTISDCHEEYIPDEECRLYIQNLPKDMQRKDILKHFSKYGDVLRLYLTHSNKGFVEYEFCTAAQLALKKSRHVIGGTEIRVLKSLMERPQVFVGNLPLHAKRGDVTSALSVFGAVLNVKFVQGKNYAFATFRDQATMKYALASGHALLEGRKLVIKTASNNKVLCHH